MDNVEMLKMRRQGQIEGLKAASDLAKDLLKIIQDSRLNKTIMAVPGAESRVATCEAIVLCIGCRIAAEIVRHTAAHGALDPRFKDMSDRSTVAFIEAMEGRRHMLESALKKAREIPGFEDNIRILEEELAAMDKENPPSAA